MNSIIEAQITLKEEVEKEIDRCKKDPHYMYLNYFLLEGKPPQFKEEDKVFFDIWQKLLDKDNKLIRGIIDLKGGRGRRQNITLDEAEILAFENWRKNNKPKTRRRNKI